MSKEVKKIVLQPSHVAVYNFVKGYIEKKIYAPEVSEIARGVKLVDRQVFRILDDLCYLKVISREKRIKRSLKILKGLTE